MYDYNSKTFPGFTKNGPKRTFRHRRLWYANFVSIFYNIWDLRHLRMKWIIYIKMIKYPQLNFHFFSYLHNATCIYQIWLVIRKHLLIFQNLCTETDVKSKQKIIQSGFIVCNKFDPIRYSSNADWVILISPLNVKFMFLWIFFWWWNLHFSL